MSFDLRTFFTVVAKGPWEVNAADVFEFLPDGAAAISVSCAEARAAASSIARRCPTPVSGPGLARLRIKGHLPAARRSR